MTATVTLSERVRRMDRPTVRAPRLVEVVGTFRLPPISRELAAIANGLLESADVARGYSGGELLCETTGRERALYGAVESMASRGWLDDDLAHNVYVVQGGKATRYVVSEDGIDEDGERDWCPGCNKPHQCKAACLEVRS